MRRFIFNVDDGAQHTICALDEADAMGVYVRSYYGAGDWPSEEPVCVKVADDKIVSIDTQSGFGVLKATAFDWQQLLGASTYLGCSEY